MFDTIVGILGLIAVSVLWYVWCYLFGRFWGQVFGTVALKIQDIRYNRMARKVSIGDTVECYGIYTGIVYGKTGVIIYVIKPDLIGPGWSEHIKHVRILEKKRTCPMEIST